MHQVRDNLLRKARQGKALAELDITDMHAHVGRFAFNIPAVNGESILGAMDRTGVSRTLVAAMPRMSLDDARRGNDEVLAAIQVCPDRLLGYCYLWPAAAQCVQAEMTRCIAAGCIGAKLHNMNGVSYAHPAYRPALAIASERRMPVLCHSWGQREEFDEFRRIIERHPGCTLLLAHAGACNLDGYIRFAREHDHVYLELAGTAAPRGAIEALVQGAGAERIVWGSDVCFINQAQQLGRVIGAPLTHEQTSLVLSQNAHRILSRIRQ